MLRLKTILQYNYIYFILLLMVFGVTFFRVSLPKKSKYDISEKEFKGVLLNYKVDGDKFTFILKGKEKIKCTYYIKTKEEQDYLKKIDEGIEIAITGVLSEPLNNTIPNTFNYKKYLKQNNINFTLSVQKYTVINNKIKIHYKIKNWLKRHISNYKSQDYLLALIIGDKSLMDEEIKNSFQKLGVSHIFAISGMHISLLSSVILKVLKKLKLKESLSYLIVIVFLCFYVFITNFQASIIRSIGLFILIYINRRLDFNIEVLNILLLDISLILIIFPNFLYNIGFLYSSIVSFSLIKYSYLIKGNYITKMIKVSLIAFLFSLPITLINNYEFNLFTIINNLVIVPLVSLILYPLSMLSFFIVPLDNILLIVINLLELLTPYLLNISIVVPKINLIFIITYYLFLILFFKSYKKFYLLLIIILIVINKIVTIIDPNCYIYFLDVGQGDSIVIKKGRECILIDTGGKIEFKKEDWKVGKKYYITDNTIMFLHSIGVSKINYCLITHGDQDHGGEILNLLNNIKVDNVIINKGEVNYLEKQIPKEMLTKFYKGKLNFKLLDTGINYANENDNSIISLLNVYNYNILFMGDASKKVELDILKKYKIKADLIKLGHHGSKTSSSEEFLDKIKVKDSIISSGRKNRYNHPNKETIETLNKLNIKFKNTQDKGSILYKISKNNVTISYTSP